MCTFVTSKGICNKDGVLVSTSLKKCLEWLAALKAQKALETQRGLLS